MVFHGVPTQSETNLTKKRKQIKMRTRKLVWMMSLPVGYSGFYVSCWISRRVRSGSIMNDPCKRVDVSREWYNWRKLMEIWITEEHSSWDCFACNMCGLKDVSWRTQFCGSSCVAWTPGFLTTCGRWNDVGPGSFKWNGGWVGHANSILWRISN